jgi:hypothetical protein
MLAFISRSCDEHGLLAADRSHTKSLTCLSETVLNEK